MLKQIEDTIKLISVFTSGLFLGVLAGALITTQSGEETKKDIAKGALKLKELTKDKLEKLEDIGVHKVREVGHAIRDAADKIYPSTEKLNDKNNGKNHKPDDIKNIPVM